MSFLRLNNVTDKILFWDTPSLCSKLSERAEYTLTLKLHLDIKFELRFGESLRSQMTFLKSFIIPYREVGGVLQVQSFQDKQDGQYNFCVWKT